MRGTGRWGTPKRCILASLSFARSYGCTCAAIEGAVFLDQRPRHTNSTR